MKTAITCLNPVLAAFTCRIAAAVRFSLLLLGLAVLAWNPQTATAQPCPPGGGPVEMLTLEYTSVGGSWPVDMRFEVTTPAGNAQVLLNRVLQPGERFTLVSSTPGGNIGDNVDIIKNPPFSRVIDSINTSCQPGATVNIGDTFGNNDWVFTVVDTPDLECSPDDGGLIDFTIDVDADGDGSGSPEINDVLGFSFDLVNVTSTPATGTAKLYYPTSRFSYVSGGASNSNTSASCAPNNADCGEVTFNFSLGSGGTQSFNAQLQALAGNASGVPTTVAAEIFTDDVVDLDSDPGNLVLTVDASGNISPSLAEDDECVRPFTLLPVELTRFDAVLDGRAAALHWATASETNNAGFEIQHRVVTNAEKNAGTFEVLGFVDGHGTTLEEKTYAYQIDDLQPGRHVFRLKQIDFDGTFEFSAEVEVSVEMPEAYVLSDVYPNPFNPQARLDFAVKQSQEVTVSVYNLLGQQVLSLYRGTPAAGVTQSLVIDGHGLQSGMYLVRIQGEKFVDTRTFTLIK